MTLIFKKFIRNSILAQMKIQHFDANVQVFKRGEIPEKVMNKMQQLWGKNFGLDGDYWIFFSGQNITQEIADKTLFKIANNALGRAANDMKENEIKVFWFKDDETADAVPEKTSDEVQSLADPGADDANSGAISDTMDESVDNPQPGEKFAFLKILMK